MAFAIRGAGVARTSTNALALFCGSGTKLYKFASPSTAWTNVTRSAGGNYALATDDYWQFIPFGSTLVALNGTDAIQYIDINVGTNFAALSAAATGGSPPTWARYAAVVGDLFLFANTSNSPREVLWPGRNDLTWWTKGPRDSDSQTMPDGGDIMGITGFEQGGLIVQTDTVRGFSVRTDRAILEFHRIEQAQGTRSPYSIIPHQGGALYYGTRGFVAVHPASGSEPIGDGYINDWFLANSSVKTRPKAVIGALDPVRARFFWLFASASNPTSTTLDHVLCFDPSTVGTEYGPWTHAPISASYIFPAASAATTLAGIAALYATLSLVPQPFGSDVWKGGAPALAMFSSSNVLNLFSGSNLAAMVDTAILAPIPGRRTFIRGFRPVTDVTTAAGQTSSNITGRVGTTERAEDALDWKPSQSLTPQGLIPCRASGRLIRAEVSIPAGATWNHLAGLDDIDLIQDGER